MSVPPVGSYRKKPVVIEAFRFDGTPPDATNAESIIGWMGGGVILRLDGDDLAISIRTLEGNMRADLGDWIIKGVEGEFYPCKPNIFAKTYEDAD